jgi:acetyl esterase/lipase
MLKILIMSSLIILTLNLQAQVAKDSSINYIHQSRTSLMAKYVKGGARVFVSKNSIEKKLKKENFVSEPASIPKKYFKEFQISTTEVNDRKVFTISSVEKKSGKYILFLHGGGYINNIFGPHWDFAAQLVRETGCTVIIPDYPLAPSLTYVDAFAMLDKIYKNLLLNVDPENIIFMGDSAGGGLALAFAEKNSVEGMSQPEQIILISPWLDVSMTNPEIKEIQKQDPILSARTLVMAGKVWAGNSDTKNYLVSPIYGDLKGLPKVSVFIGTSDILVADCRKLKTLMEQQSIPMNYFEYPKMFHDWVMFYFLKESKIAVKQICELIVG